MLALAQNFDTNQPEIFTELLQVLLGWAPIDHVESDVEQVRMISQGGEIIR